MVKNIYYYVPKNDTVKYECIIINDNISQKRCTEVNDGIIEYEIKMVKIRYNKGEIEYELNVLPEEIKSKLRM